MKKPRNHVKSFIKVFLPKLPQPTFSSFKNAFPDPEPEIAKSTKKAFMTHNTKKCRQTVRKKSLKHFVSSHFCNYKNEKTVSQYSAKLCDGTVKSCPQTASIFNDSWFEKKRKISPNLGSYAQKNELEISGRLGDWVPGHLNSHFGKTRIAALDMEFRHFGFRTVLPIFSH